MDYFVNARSIQRWATDKDARYALPHLLRQLVVSTASGITEVSFPAYESVQRPGFDGVVVCLKGNAWIPAGRSVWEFGVDKSVKGKADREFSKRTTKTTQQEQEESYFVFVTPRHWKNKKSWASAQKGDWKGVRAFDSDDLEHWLEAAPRGVSIWLGRKIGTRPSGVDDLEARWSGISKSTSPELAPVVFLAGRDQNLEPIRTWLAGEAACCAIESRSPSEVVDFFCAAVAAMPEIERVAVESRAVIIESYDAWTILRELSVPSVFVVEPSVALQPEDIARAVSNGHHVLVALEPDRFARNERIQLGRAGQFELTKALEQCGHASVKAEQFARAAGGSLSVLKHLLTRHRTKLIPPWTSESNDDVLRACLILGGWDGANPADQEAFERIAHRPYGDCESVLQKMANRRDPLLHHAAGKWRLLSKDHAWILFEDRVSRSTIHEFEPLAIEIFVDDDPRFELPETNRLTAQLQGHVPKYSATLKRHVAETVALLGSFGDQLSASSSADITGAVNRIVAGTLSPTSTWHRWASLAERLPLLAEACPRAFLDAVRADLASSTPELVKLMHDESDSGFSRCNHAGLLWGLEVLAWTTDYLGEVAEHLLTLANQDPGGQWSNRPSNSLCEILSYWMPYTTANVEERIQVLDLLMRRNRDAAWQVLFQLLPGASNMTSHPTHKPYWRGWADGWTPGATRGDSQAFITAMAERLIEHSGLDVSRWTMLFGEIGRIPLTVREQFITAAHELAQTNLSDTDRRLLSESLSGQIALHRLHQGAGWSLSGDSLNRLDAVLEQLQPKSASMRHAWLFARWPAQYCERRGSVTENENALDQARHKALGDILRSEGLHGIEYLVDTAESPFDAGRVLAAISGDEFLASFVVPMLDGEDRQRDFAGGFIWSRFYPDNWQWVDRTLALCSTDSSKAWFCASLPFSSTVWDRVEAYGHEVRRLYWHRCPARNSHLPVNDVERAVGQLVQIGRPGPAIDLLSMALHGNQEVNTETLFLPLESLLTLSADRAKSQFGQVLRYGIPKVIDALQSRADVDLARLLRIEWQYLRLLDDHTGHEPKALYRQLASSPEFFVEVLSMCFRPRRQDRDGEPQPEPTENERHLAEQAFHLLHDWRRVPGSDDEGRVVEAALEDWCIRAIRLAEEAGRLGVCHSYIGQVFAHAPDDEDGTWPCVAVRRVADKIATDSLASGMRCGILNARGATWASGGAEERQHAKKWKDRADRIRYDSHFVAGVLDSVAQSYEHDAKWWAERERWEE